MAREAISNPRYSWNRAWWVLMLVPFFLLYIAAAEAEREDGREDRRGELDVKSARWDDNSKELLLRVSGENIPDGREVTLLLYDAITKAQLVGFPVTLMREGKFESLFVYPIANSAEVPCRVRVELENLHDERRVERAPKECSSGEPTPSNQAPTANAGPDQVITLSPGQNNASVTLDGSGSTDPDGTIVSYDWSGPGNPADVVQPSVTLGPGVHIFTLVVTDNDGAESAPDSVTITINEAPPLNQPPVADAGPDQTITLVEGQSTVSVTLNGSGSNDPDGTIAAYTWTGTPDPADVVQPMVTLAAGVHLFTLVVTDNDGASSAPDSVTITVNPFVAGDPHAGLTFANYQGSTSCLECHAGETRQAHAAVHYQWRGETPHSFYRDGNGQLVNLGEGGKLGGINDFCGYPDINFIGLLTDVDGNTKSGGCALCHAGTGEKPNPDPSALLADGIRTQLDNVDCLMCHSDVYRRKVENVQQLDGVSRLAFVPDAAAITGGLNQTLDIRGRPSRASCVACHAYAGGGCNSKRGDIQQVHAEPPDRNFDIHMASRALGGAGLDCLDCHTSTEHRIAGRGVDLRPTDLDTKVACTDCHEAQPHHESDLDMHTARVDCRSCHIPNFAKPTALDGATDMFRDYSKAPVLNVEKRLYEPYQVMQSNVVPEYVFDNGTSEFYRFLDPIRPKVNGRVLMAGPLGSVVDPGVKLIPVKHHMAIQPHDPETGAILPLRMGILFTGRLGGTLLPLDDIVNQAVLAGAAAVPALAHVNSSDRYDFVPTERFMGISHEVTPQELALNCSDCHGATATRIDFDALGYTPLPQRNPDLADNCASGCHSDESDEWSGAQFFSQLHEKHVNDEGINCSECHGFSTAN